MDAGNDVRIYHSMSYLSRPIALFKEIAKGFYEGRELGVILAVRDLKAQYRQTILGFLWIFILPLVNTLTWVFLQSQGVVEVAQTELPYPLYVFMGSMIWAIFVDSVTSPLTIITQAKPMLSKVNFPHESLIISSFLQVLINGGIKYFLILAVVLLSGVEPDAMMLLSILGFIFILIIGISWGLILLPLGLLYNDISKVLPLVMQFFMFLTPVVFPIPKEGFAKQIFELNPFSSFVMTLRNWSAGISSDFTTEFLTFTLVSSLCLIFFWVVIKLSMPILIERMNA